MIKVGVVGAGYWAKNMLRAIASSDDSEIAYICDLNEAALASVSHTYPKSVRTSDITQLLNDETLDAIYLATPPNTHGALARQCLEAGKHVLVEKPLATDGFDALQLIEVAARQQRTLMVGHTFLYSPPVQKIKELISSGQLGTVFYIDSLRVNLGKHQPSGVVWDLAPHDLSIICDWLDATPVAVSACARSYRGTKSEDVSFITLEFPGGVLAQIHLSWLAPAKLRRTTISGSEQMIVYDDTVGAEAVRIYDQGVEPGDPSTYGEFQLTYRRGDVTIPVLEATEPLRNEWDHFLHCVKTGATPRTDGAAGYRVVKIIEAIHRSIRSGKREEIEWVMRRTDAPQKQSRQRFGLILNPESVQ